MQLLISGSSTLFSIIHSYVLLPTRMHTLYIILLLQKIYTVKAKGNTASSDELFLKFPNDFFTQVKKKVS